MNLIADIRFAEESSEELKNAAQVLRYVAAINPQATRQEFVAACVDCGYRANKNNLHRVELFRYTASTSTN